ncbi:MULTISPECIES: SusC/RagA family TonB-linked outer membrane protein [Niastella]|uniref:SusC/RagA family TonB-linked outer membrane protein n=1 Tax=Niastella soli TaxID=2821487 RepID=A0ABS3Z4Z3_9BACT|nr:SusC/RagA family TonB-linked outer membrane protein [Niastella soli]MBO9204461.1 SusC/RagA family TonB-linked outer membrane protein [Niastella soli]
MMKTRRFMCNLFQTRQWGIVLFFVMMLVAPFVSLAQERTLEGKVVDAANQPLKGVSVTISNTKRGVTTDDNGHFVLKVTPDASITFSFSGFVAQTIKVPATGELSIRLEVSQKAMDEVVVIGYGQVRKKDLTGSITQIRPDKISDQNPNTTQDIVRGTPGVTVGFDASAKGGGSIQIRGQRSVYTDAGHNDPLLVLDGMIFYGELSEINPDDIEQIDILKDASAAAVYGAKSANGVLIITTKKGKKGKPRFNFTANHGISTMGINRKVMSPEGYMKYRQDFYTAPTYGVNAATGNYEAYQDGKTKAGYYEVPTDENLAKWGITLAQWRAYTVNGTAGDNEIWAKRLLLQGTVMNNYLAGKTFDWYDNTFRTGHNQDYNLSASGGSDNYNYYMSMGYLSNQGLVKGNDFKAIRSNIKMDAKMTKWLDISGNINFQHRDEGDSAADWNRAIIYNSPYANYKDDTGALQVHPMGENSVNNYGYNYDFIRQYTARDKAYTVLNTILTARVKLPFNITYSFNASPRYQFYHERYFESSKNPDWKATNGLVYREQTQRFDWSLNNTINWDQTFGKHRVNVTLVQEAEKRQSWKDRVEAKNILPSDALGFHETTFGDKNKSTYDADDVKETADGLLARAIYTYNDRYMFTASFRRDGYSAFGTSNPRANFISLAGAWTFTNENFFHWDPMSMGKLRLSFGQNGNRSLSDPYLALANLTAGTGSASMGYLDNSGALVQYRYLRLDRLANPNLHWEKTESFNTGIDFGFLNNRLTGTVDYYVTPTIDMIMNRALPNFTGFTSITTNLGKVENKGFEFSLTSQNMHTRDFNWSTTFGFSKYKNTIKHLYYVFDAVLDAQGNVVSTKERDDIGNGWFIGQPVSAIWNYNVTGIWQANEAAEAALAKQRPGDPKVANTNTDDDVKNANGTFTPTYNDKDKAFLGQTSAPIMWSLRNDFTYKNFNFSFNMYSYWGHKSLVNLYLNQDNNTSLITNLANTWQKDYWTVNNPSNNVARLSAAGPAGVQAPGKLYDRSFIRLDNVTLGYTVPAKLISKAGLDKVKVFANIRNAALWKKDKNWKYGDIETFSTTSNNEYRGSLAPRIFTFGLNVNF